MPPNPAAPAATLSPITVGDAATVTVFTTGNIQLTSPDSKRLQHDPAGLLNAYATYDVPRKL